MILLPETIETLDGIAARYAAIFCDVWGVLHNGVDVFPEAERALSRARATGAVVVLITNSPRPHMGVEGQLTAMGIDAGAWDRIVTSGDATRELIRAAPGRIFHLGPERDRGIFEGLDADLVEDMEADVVVCTGFFDDEQEVPADYADMLGDMRARDLPFICANPDIVVERGDDLIWCAGALARDYAALGGRTLIAGKPHRPIYDAALKNASEAAGREIGRREVLAIGDGVLTDVKGASDNGVDVIFVTGGIHWRDYGEQLTPDAARLSAFLDHHGHRPVAVMPRLR